jgi:hypothetical protein
MHTPFLLITSSVIICSQYKENSAKLKVRNDQINDKVSSVKHLGEKCAAYQFHEHLDEHKAMWHYIQTIVLEVKN